MNIFKTLSGKLKKSQEKNDDYQFSILGGLQPRPFPDGRPAKHMYEGTASANKVAKRRAKNKVARASRKRNR